MRELLQWANGYLPAREDLDAVDLPYYDAALAAAADRSQVGGDLDDWHSFALKLLGGVAHDHSEATQTRPNGNCPRCRLNDEAAALDAVVPSRVGDGDAREALGRAAEVLAFAREVIGFEGDPPPCVDEQVRSYAQKRLLEAWKEACELSSPGGVQDTLAREEGRGQCVKRFRVVDNTGEMVCMSRGPEDPILRVERWDRWTPERAPHRLQRSTVTTSEWVDAPAPASGEETTDA